MFPVHLWTKPLLQQSPGGPGLGPLSFLPHLPLGHPLAAHAQSGSPDKDGSPGGNGLTAFSLPSSLPLFKPGEYTSPHLYTQIHPSFLQTHAASPYALSFLSPRGGGMLHSPADGVRDSHPSAFMPAKRPRLESYTDRSESPPDGERGERGGRSAGTTPVGHGDDGTMSPRLSPASHPSDHLDRHSPEHAKDLRKWVRADGGGVRCPICHSVVQACDLRGHLARELTDLRHFFRSGRLATDLEVSPRRSDSPRQTCLSPERSPPSGGHRHQSSRSRYETFLRIRCNRESRLGKLRLRRKKLDSPYHQIEDIVDPIVQREAPMEEEQIDVIGCEDKDEPHLPQSTITSTHARESPLQGPVPGTSSDSTNPRHGSPVPPRRSPDYSRERNGSPHNFHTNTN